MPKIIETKINRFDGGIVNDPRDPRGNICRMVSNFDVITNPSKMTPYRSSESGDVNADATRIRNFLIARRTDTTYSLFGYGRTSAASDVAEIYYKDLTTGAANDLDDSDWTETASNTGATGSPDYELFVFYRRLGLIYGAAAGARIWSYDPVTPAFTVTELSLTYTYIGQGLVHSKDDILYFPYYNNGGAAGAKSFIARKNGSAAWESTALTLPDHLVPVSICEFGNYLAIACAQASRVGNSRVFLWDRDSTLTTLDESLDLGVGTVRIIEEIDGELITISQVGGAATNSIGPAGTISFGDRVIFRRLVGNRFKKFMQLTGGRNSTKIPIDKQKVDDRLYFQMIIEFNSNATPPTTVRTGVWSLGRTESGSPLSLVHERTSDNNVALVAGDHLRGFFAAGDYLFQVYQVSSTGVYTMTKTDDANLYSHNSIYESVKFDGRQVAPEIDASHRKDLLGVTVMHEYLPSGASVTVAYRIDNETSFTTILTSDGSAAIFDSAVNIESTEAALPKDYREIEFRLVSTGGAEITGFSFKEEITGKRVYD